MLRLDAIAYLQNEFDFIVHVFVKNPFNRIENLRPSNAIDKYFYMRYIERRQKAVLIDAYMPSVRMAQTTRSVSRTVTLPAWLNAAVIERNINFSQVLQEALKTQFKSG